MLSRRFTLSKTTSTLATTLFTSLRFQSSASGGEGGAASIAKPVAPADFGAVPIYKKPPPAPVGTPLPVHQGGGTNIVSDPYIRRLPNQPSRLPESAVVRGSTSASAVFTQEERSDPKLLANKRLPIGEWLRKQVNSSSSENNNTLGCPLLWYLQSLTLPSLRVLGPREQQIIAEFEEKTISEAAKANSLDPSLEKARWQQKVVRKFTQDLHLFNPEKFQQQIQNLTKNEVMTFFNSKEESGASYAAELEEVASILAANAISIRNHNLRQLTSLVNSTVHEEGGLVWSRFFDVVERNKKEFLLNNDKRMAMWISSREGATPVVSPAVCLLFLSVTSMDTRQAVAKPHALQSALQGVLPEDYFAINGNNNNLWNVVDQILNREDLFDFCLKNVDKFLEPMDSTVVRSLRNTKAFADLAGAAEKVSSGANAIMEGESSKLFEEIIPAFENMTAVHSLVQRVMAASGVNNNNSTSSNNNTINVRSFITTILQNFVDETGSSTSTTTTSPSTTIQQKTSYDLQPFFKALQPHWSKIYASFARQILSDPTTCQLMSHNVATAGLSAGSQKTQSVSTVLFEKQHVQVAMKALSTLFFEHRELAEATQTTLKYQLLSRTDNILDCAKMILLNAVENQKVISVPTEQQQNPSSSVSVALQLASEIDTLVKKRVQEKVQEPSRPDWFYKAAVDQVAAENPNWLKQQVGPIISESSDLVVTPDPLKAHELLLRIYLRLTYVPHAANAVLKSRHRRRIGPIAKHKNEYNIEAEIGFVENYNSVEYKQWDWQGWYQRMMDVFHRNISIRVRLDDIRRLDNEGKPFIDLQTERRLRILAEDRVGSGMIKLDSERFEDKSDNLDYGTGKLQQLLSESKKAQLGKEYWPTVEVKVREPSGQSKMRYSVLDWDRMEKQSSEMFEKYRKAKARAIYVPPTETWLTLGSASSASKAQGSGVDAEGYTVDTLFSSLGEEEKK